MENLIYWFDCTGKKMKSTTTVSSSLEHYKNLLGEVYAWSAGGIDRAVTVGQTEIESIELHSTSVNDGNIDKKIVVDLGAGFGMHSIPLSKLGYSVIAIDNSEILLQHLREHTTENQVKTVVADLLEFNKYLDGSKAQAILCMGDTLTHLPSLEYIKTLYRSVYESLVKGGRFVMSFRNYIT